MIKNIKIDIEKMKLGEQEEFETLAGCSIYQLSDKGLSGKRLAALIYIFARREDDKVTFQDCLELDMTEASNLMVVDADPKELTD
jgi:hypothetical protein